MVSEHICASEEAHAGAEKVGKQWPQVTKRTTCPFQINKMHKKMTYK